MTHAMARCLPTNDPGSWNAAAPTIAYVAAERGTPRGRASTSGNRWRSHGELALLDRPSTPHREPRTITARPGHHGARGCSGYGRLHSRSTATPALPAPGRCRGGLGVRHAGPSDASGCRRRPLSLA